MSEPVKELASTKICRVVELMIAGQCAHLTELAIPHKGLGSLFEAAEILLADALNDVDALEREIKTLEAG